MKLINRQLVSAWRLKANQLNSFVIAVVCLTMQDTMKAANFIGESMQSTIVDDGILASLSRRVFGGLAIVWSPVLTCIYLCVRPA